MKKLMIYIFVFFSTYLSYGNEGIGISQNYGNIRVLSYKETDREDFFKPFIIGQLAQKIAQRLNYSAPIYLECYLGINSQDGSETEYQINLQNYRYNNEKAESEKLIIRQQAKNYDILETLKLVEYAIENKKKIKKNQSSIKSNFFYDRGKNQFTIDSKIIKQIVQKENSPLINNIATTRINRPTIGSQRKTEISYYWQNNLFYIYRTKRLTGEKTSRDIILLTLPQVYQFENLDLAYLIFDQVNGFYYINVNKFDNETGNNKVSVHHRIENGGIKDFGNQIHRISDEGDISISFSHGPMGSGNKRLLIYFQEPDILIQDVYAKLGIENKN